jgi:hypothetical protein
MNKDHAQYYVNEHMLIHLALTTTLPADTAFILIIQDEKLMDREIKLPAASKWQSWNLNPASTTLAMSLLHKELMQHFSNLRWHSKNFLL